MIVQYLSSYIPTNIIYEHFAIYDLQIFHIPKVLQKITTTESTRCTVYKPQTKTTKKDVHCIYVLLLFFYLHIFLPLSPMFHVGRCREHPPP